jgi:hypothetical protein
MKEKWKDEEYIKNACKNRKNKRVKASEECKKKHSETNKERGIKPPEQPKIKVICVETGEIFNSITECSIKMNIAKSNIAETVKKNRQTTHGLHFNKYE